MKSCGVMAARFHLSLFTRSSSICCEHRVSGHQGRCGPARGRGEAGSMGARAMQHLRLRALAPASRAVLEVGGEGWRMMGVVSGSRGNTRSQIKTEKVPAA